MPLPLKILPMKLLIAILFSVPVFGQINPYIGGGLGSLNGVSVTMKGGVQVADRVIIEAAAAFSQQLPYQHSLKAGYRVGAYTDWYAIPFVGVVQHHYGQDSKNLNEVRFAAGIEAGRRINLDGTNGEFLNRFDLFVEYFGKYGGVGFRVAM